MAVTTADLLSPAGPVEVTLFPGEDTEDVDNPGSTLLETRLAAYISRAEVKTAGIAFTDPDPAVEAWALHLTFSAAYTLAVSRPSSEDTKVKILGSQGFSKDQRDALQRKADSYLREYDALVAAVPTTANPSGIPTRSTGNVFEW